MRLPLRARSVTLAGRVVAVGVGLESEGAQGEPGVGALVATQVRAPADAPPQLGEGCARGLILALMLRVRRYSAPEPRPLSGLKVGSSNCLNNDSANVT